MLTFESPLEEIFYHDLCKYVDRDSVLTQMEAPTPNGVFRLDFAVKSPYGWIALECDGRDFHDRNRDEWRDAMILGRGAVVDIVRFRGCDIFYRMTDCMYVLSAWRPKMFTERGREILERTASDRIKSEVGELLLDTQVMATYRAEGMPTLWVIILRRTADPACKSRQLWRSYFEFSKGRNGDIGDLMHQWRESGGGAARIVE